MFVDEKAVGEPQPVKVGTLKLSEAIRIGARKGGQCFEQWYLGGRSCALGAAYEGAFGRRDVCAENLASVWGFIEEKIKPPFPEMYERSLLVTIAHLNDDYHWTREEIANWLESQGY